MSEIKKSYGNLILEMESLNGFRIINDINHLKETNHIFNNNFLELKNIIEKYGHDIGIWDIKNRPQLNLLLLEVARLLHNYSASAFTLIEHTRAFRKKIKEKNLEKIFKIEIEQFATNEEAIFMKKLRNYNQHRSLPFTSANITLTEHSFEQKLTLSKNKLLEWGNWNLESKKYMAKFDDDIEIIAFCEGYYNLIQGFYIFFYNEVCNAYANEIREIQEFGKNIEKLYPPL